MLMRLFKILLLLIWLGTAVVINGQESIPEIAAGTVEGSLTDSFYFQRYRFQARAGERITIRMEMLSGNLDPYLFLFDSNDQLLADNDDIGDGSRNAQIVFEPAQDATYIVEAARFQQEGGTTSGRYGLTLEISSAESTITVDPLSLEPTFGVQFTYIHYSESASATLNAEADRQYFALGGKQGEFVRLLVEESDPTLATTVSILNQNLTVISRVAENTDDRKVIYAAIPQTGWYLIEVTRQQGEGAFTVTPELISNTVLTQDVAIDAAFDRETNALFFIFNATINERIFINMTVLSGEGIIPELSVIDLAQETLTVRESQGVQTRVSLTVPRSGPYIVQARNLGTAGDSNFRLQLRRTEADTSKLLIRDVTYNNNFSGIVEDANPIDYYRFGGKAGELVTIEMSPADDRSELDPYLILTDSALNELVFNDNAGLSSSARIVQFLLPADGDYYILASRAGLGRGTSAGRYRMVLTAGQIALQSGILTATLAWQGDADLNLFIRTPDGTTLSWANPQVATGNLQIDSNTGCETPTAQPVEHIYFPGQAITPGDYTVWVWYQNVCSVRAPVAFTLVLTVNGQPVLTLPSAERERAELEPFSRFEASVFLTEGVSGSVINSGTITSPSPQQIASQGGDILVLLGQPVNGTITNDVYAQFYQFSGAAGDQIRITVERVTGNLDPIVVLRDAQDRTLLMNDDISATDRNARITYTLPESGRYIIGVTRFGLRDGTTTGDYRLLVERE
jgi:hypothetical protein